MSADKPDLFSSLPTAEEEKAAAFAAFDGSEPMAAFILRCRHALLKLVQRADAVTIEDVRAACPLPEGMNPKVYGGVPGALAAFGCIARSGYAAGKRRDSHARPLAVWRLASAECVYLWVAANPLGS